MIRTTLVAALAATLSVIAFSQDAFADDTTRQKAVLITGATTGIGRATAEHLAAKGYFVYAGARKHADMEELNKIDNIMAVRLDVTKQDQVDAAVKLIEDQGRGLWGLVNNAGVAVFAPLTEAKQSDLEFIFNVNVFGVFRVTQAFAPMVIESKGRIVNVSSISGIWSAPTAGMYSASKHALSPWSYGIWMYTSPPLTRAGLPQQASPRIANEFRMTLMPTGAILKTFVSGGLTDARRARNRNIRAQHLTQ